MSCYFIAQITISDKAAYQQYLDGFDEIFARHAGEVLAVDDAPEILEGCWSGNRTVLIRFPDKQALHGWYHSHEYQQLAQYRYKASSANVVAVSSGD